MSKTEKEEGPRAFARFLEQLGDGEAHAELSAELHRLMETLHDQALATGPTKGALTLKLSFAVDPRGTVDVAYDVAVKEPKRARSKGVFWLTKGNNLTAHNPRQERLPLREVAAPEVRDVEASAPAAAREV